MKKILKYFMLFLSHSIFMIITAMFPKDNKLWVFGCWEGRLYADNAKYFFEWVNNEKKDLTAVWITSNDGVYELIKKKGYQVYKAGSAKAFWAISRAAVVIETEGNVDIGGYRPGRAKIIQLWHGVGPKSLLWNKNEQGLKKFIRNIVFDNRANSFWMVPSEQNKNVMMSLFNILESHMFVTGYSRDNDLKSQTKGSDVARFLSDNFNNYKKIVYMPTHRNFGKDKTSAFTIQDLKNINSFLVENNYMMLFKPHIHELQNFLGIKNELTNIILATDQDFYSDVYSYLDCFDLMICDYSSVAYDFLCTGKPIVIFAYDLDDYKKKEGLFDYFEELPLGPFCYDWNSTLSAAKDLLEDDQWKEQREKCRLTFHTFNDKKNNERIYNAILSLLK